ncbi:hypothetical protein [Caulobacter segnis]|jgi:hypothetical protein|uniref:Phasin domain-containing protein n=1 Tax=Caulobacter segnis TaxID=88688 RepID=A0A2W5WBX8_9CAUL|nr:hypothetical protein [Caulobacter segnis]PZR31058.1 MAG: hypothetical protein DI526_20780 [Caulobacter segnis]
MSYPFDQLTALASANQKLALKCANIARAAGQRQSKIVAKAFFTASEQAAEDKPAPLSFPILPGYSHALAEAEECRQVSLNDTKAAFEEWRANVEGLFSPEAAQKQFANAYQAWSKAFLAPLATTAASVAEAAEPAARAKAKAAA